MRRAFVAAAVLSACNSSSPPSHAVSRDAAPLIDAPAVDAGPPVLPTRHPAARVAGVIDDRGVGKLELGTLASDVPNFERQRGDVRFTQQGVDKTTFVRFGGEARIPGTSGVEEMRLQINPTQDRVTDITVVGKDSATAEGIRVGSTRAQVIAAYGPADDHWTSFSYGPCDVFLEHPGVGFCYRDDVVVEIDVPALRSAPPTAGIALTTARALVEGRVVQGGEALHAADVVAPCLLEVRRDGHTSTRAFRFDAHNVYGEAGGWRTRDGGFLFCAGEAVYVMDATGAAWRWKRRNLADTGWHAEPAVCRAGMHDDTPTIACTGITERFPHEMAVVGDQLREWTQLRLPLPHRLIRALVDDPPSGPWAECETLGARVWHELELTLAFLGQADAGAADRVRSAATVRELVSACASATAEERTCLRAAPSLLDLPSCHMRMWGVVITQLLELRHDHPPDLTPPEARAARAAFAGRWVQAAFPYDNVRISERVMTFSSDGAVATDDVVGRVGAGPGPDHFAVTTPRHGELDLDAPTQGSHYAVAWKDRDHFFRSGWQVVSWVPPDHAAFDVSMPTGTGDLAGTILVRGGACKLLLQRGTIADATCTFDATSFTVATIDRMGKPVTARFDLVDGYLVQAGATPFVRRR